MDLTQITQNFVSELQRSEKGDKTSLPFIINPLLKTPLLEDDQIFQAMTIGGSVFKKGLIKKRGEKIEALSREEKMLPVFNTKADLLNFVASELDGEIRILALNFAYQVDPVFENNKLDGVLLSSSKEHRFEGLIGKRVGHELEKFIEEKLSKNVLISLANDTICLLLSGLTKYKNNQLAAGIVGTGINFAFFLSSDQAVNLESGNFDKFPQSDPGKYIDENSAEPNTYLFEKEVSGAYLYQLFNFRMQNEPGFMKLNSSLELDELARSGEEFSQEAKEIIQRSAELVSTQIAGITAFKKTDMIFVMEGSLFWKGYQYKETVEKVVKELVPEFNVEFIQIPDSSLLGAAELVI